ncbi:MAG: NADH-quinone oxidoreductase subunit C [Bradymonadales bacterium]|nr:NADH-quinone oxidoreductase subunit C [Bradymonadales bacterium]
MSKAVLERLAEKFSSEVTDTHSSCGDDTAVLKRGRLKEIALWLKDDPANRFDLFRDVTCVDYLERQPRFEVVYHLYSLSHRHAIRLKVPLEEVDLALDSVAEVWPAAEWGEREVFDLFGVRFVGHPFLRRIILYEEFEGHPLRKDYAKRKSQPRIELRAPERDAIDEFELWGNPAARGKP